MVLEKNIGISVVVPSLDGDENRLIEQFKNQTIQPDEIEVVVGVRPNGKARNLGVERTSGEIIIFIDDDAFPGTPELIERLVLALLEDESIGVAGAPRVLPQEASWFQKRVAYEVPRTVNPIPRFDLETNPPLEGYGHSLITTTCCAVRRSDYLRVGGFSERMISGVDTEFFYRLRREGYRFILLSKVFVKHPAPGNLIQLWKKFYWYGLGYGQETQCNPERKMGFWLDTWVKRALFLMGATIWLLPNVFILYSLGYPKVEIGFRPLKALSTYSVAWGYSRAWKSYDSKTKS